MNFSISSDFDINSSIWLVKPIGEIDIFNSSELKRYLLELIEDKSADICLDCIGLEYIDSTAMGALMSTLKRVKEYDGNIYIKNLKPNLTKLFTITNLDKVFIIMDGE